MAPGHTRLILVREMNVLEHVQRHFLIFRSLYQRRRKAWEGAARHTLPEYVCRRTYSYSRFREGSGRKQVCTFQPTTASENPCPNTFEPHEGRGSVMCDARFYVSRGEHPS
jgi:hypothetical protein